MAFTIHVARRFRPLVLALGLASFLLPFALELVGLLAPSYRFSAEGFTILPRTLELTPLPTIVVLTVAQVIVVLFGAVAIGILRNYLDAAERQTYTYAWHLREFVPEAHKRATDPVNRRRPR